MFDNIIASGLGFGWTIRIIAFTVPGLLIFACFTTTSRIDHKPKPLIVMDFVRPFKEIRFLILTAGSFFVFWGIFIPNNFIGLYAQSVGMSVNLSNYQLVILNAGRYAAPRVLFPVRAEIALKLTFYSASSYSVFGRITCGLLADKFGGINTITTNLILIIIFILALWLVQTISTTIAFSALYGFSSGAFISLLPVIIAQISNIREIGVRTGMVYFVSAFACLTGNPIGGALIKDNSAPYRWMQVFSVVAIFMGVVFFVLLRLTQSRNLKALV